MSHLIKSLNQLQLIFVLRLAAIIIQVSLILFVNLVLQYQLPWTPLVAVIVTELLFTLICWYYYRSRVNTDNLSIFIQSIADIIFLSLLLYFSGGATNAFVSLLLIPIAIAAVTLSNTQLLVVALGAITSYSLLLWQLPMSVMHGNMQGHFIGMWINFLFSTLVVALVVGKMARGISQRERALAKYKEELLKQEQVMALGVASAQVTHQLATPVATVQLLADELMEEQPGHSLLIDMQQQLSRCRESIASFRKLSFDIKEQTLSKISCAELLQQIQAHIALNYPDIEIIGQLIESSEDSNVQNVTYLQADASLLPAIINLINNAIRATRNNLSRQIELSWQLVDGYWQLSIHDFGAGFTLSKLAELGVKPVDSQQGLGMAVFLSYATLERLGGKLRLTNHQSGGALVTVTLPVVADNGNDK
ncbi:histidine kinase [Thalassotalea insulae]|uniref:histidine kinase n=1 Tax=Thalassotalea insulae TaxID=2056778 RepID=A0ABQ6GYP5_9GAMM|nr:HAMP domain-containing sensor histidine kinase [Thalassotalea insulae]GLX79865.1 histidine kinase [Thalassotalea insulae]